MSGLSFFGHVHENTMVIVHIFLIFPYSCIWTPTRAYCSLNSFFVADLFSCFHCLRTLHTIVLVLLPNLTDRELTQNGDLSWLIRYNLSIADLKALRCLLIHPIATRRCQ